MSTREHPERHVIQLMTERGEDDDPDAIPPHARPRPCPECRGRCEDKYGNPCETCFGEGEFPEIP